MPGVSPTQRTLQSLRDQGRLCGITQTWNPHAGIRQDLFGWIDIIALDPAESAIVAIQSTDGAHYAEHLKSLLDGKVTEKVIEWLCCGGHVEVWGSRKLLVKRSGKAQHWVAQVRKITLADYKS